MFRAAKQAALFVGLVVAACSAPPYDEQTDRLISGLQSDVDGQIVMLISLDHKIAELSAAASEASRKTVADAKAKAGYEANAAFYDKIDSQITSLRLRIDALPNEATANLDRSLDELRANLLSDQGFFAQRAPAAGDPQRTLSAQRTKAVERTISGAANLRTRTQDRCVGC